MPIEKFAQRHPNKPALIIEPGGMVVTYATLEQNSARLARFLHDKGLAKGDHIALLLENHPRFIEIVFAALRSGLYVTAINRHLTAPEVAYILVDCGAKAFVTSPEYLPIAAEAAGTAAGCRIRLVIDGEGDGFDNYDMTIAQSPNDPPPAQAGDTMLYSSGTTGRPKGIKRPLPDGVFGQAANLPGLESLGFNDRTVYLSPAPLYHAAPLGHVIGTLIRGGTAVIMARFEPLQSLALIERHRVTYSQWVPTMFVRLLKLSQAERDGFDLSSHACAIHAAAPCPVEVKRQMIAWWGPILQEYYASTERIGATRINSQEWLAHPGSVGRASADATLHICSDDGRELPVGETGLIFFERPNAAFGYHNDDEKTASSRHPEHATWITVGDIGRVDDDGYLYLTDRKSFMIISGGVNIYPQAIEDAMIMHPAVEDVAVIGVPHTDMGEEVKAVVQLRAGEQPTAAMRDTLVGFLQTRVARFALPRSIDFVDELPRTATGKLLKRSLRDKYWPASSI